MESSFRVRKLKAEAILPRKATKGASGYDLFACIDAADIVLERHPKLVGIGIALELPHGFDAQIRPRSGLSLKGVGVTLGTIDSDYRGEIMVTMYLFGSQSSFTISHGDRIAQLVVTRLADISMEEAEDLSSTERGIGGHGSTGIR